MDMLIKTFCRAMGGLRNVSRVVKKQYIWKSIIKQMMK